MTENSSEIVTVRVRRRLVAQATAAMFALAVPVLIALYWLALPNGNWPWVVALQLVIIAVAVYAAVRYTQVRVSALPGELIEHSFFGGVTHIPLADVDRVVLLELHRTMASQARLQMFVLGDSGHPLLRMRGEYWSRSSISQIVAALGDVRIERIDHPITLDELQSTKPEMLYWFERRPSKLP